MNDPMNGQNQQAPINQSPSAGPANSWTPVTPAPENDLMNQASPVPVNTNTNTPTPPPVVSNPFEATPPPISPVSGPTAPLANQPIMESTGSKSNLVLIIALIILLVVGGLVFSSWMGWISLGGLEKIWGGGAKTPTISTNTTTPTTTPATLATANPNDVQRKADLARIKTALKQYFSANQSYPVAATMEKTVDSAALKVLVPDYIAALPVDPLSPTSYYGYKSDGKSFELTAVLEDKTDPSGMTTGSIFLYRITDISIEGSGTTTSSSAADDDTINVPEDNTITP